MIVVDASVAAKWFLPEPGTAEAIALQEGEEELAAPDFIRLEVAAAFTRRVRDTEKPITPKEAEERCGKWFRFLDRASLNLIPQPDILADAEKLSIDRKLPLQDCLYLAAALRFDVPLITADPRFQKRAGLTYRKLKLLKGCQADGKD
jgi:predicted nucleic acid-binding protein